MPIYADMLRVQQIELSDQVRKSAYSFELINNKLRIFPIPKDKFKMYFQYIRKDDRFNPPVESMDGEFSKIERVVEVLYEGVYIIGADKILTWKMCDNMMRTDSDFSRVKIIF